MKNRLWVGFFVFIVIVFMSSGVSIAQPSKDKIIIGQATSLSGPFAPSNAVISTPYYDYWVKTVNATGGIYVKEYGKKLPIELIIYDDRSDIGTMTRLLDRLMVQDKVDFVLPPWGTAMHFAAAPIANKHKYILIGGAAGANKLKDVSANLPYYFQTLNFAETQVPVIVDVLEELGVKKVAVIAHDDLHGLENSEATYPALAERGIEIVLKKSYPMGVKDLSPQLKQAKALKADAFLGFSYPDEVMLATGQAIELGIDFKVFGFTVGPSFSFYKGAFGPAIQGVIGGGAWNEKTSPKAKEFSENFKKVMGEPIGNYWGALTFYSSLQHFQKCIEKAGTLDQKKIRELMAKETFDTAVGKFWYDERRIFTNHPGNWGQWQNGVFEVIDPGEKRTAAPIPKPAWPKRQK